MVGNSYDPLLAIGDIQDWSSEYFFKGQSLMPLRNKSGGDFYRPQGACRTVKPDGRAPSRARPLVKESFSCLGVSTSFVTELAVVGDSLLLEVITRPQGHGDSDLILLICKMGIRDGVSFSCVFAPLDDSEGQR